MGKLPEKQEFLHRKMVMEATGNDSLINEWQVMETYLQVKSNFAMLGIPQSIDRTTST